MTFRTPAWLPIVLAPLVLGACRSSPPTPPRPTGPTGPAAAGTDPGPRTTALVWESCGTSVEGRPIEFAVFGHARETVLIIASIHGNEAAATPLCRMLAERLARNPRWLADRRVVVVPTVNPDGVAGNRRTNARGVDLNRNFPAENYGGTNPNGERPLSEPESRALHSLVERFEPARILSFHQPLNCLDWDGPGEELTGTMAAFSPLPIKRLGPRPGSLGSWAGVDRGIPIVTVELPRSADHAEPGDLWRSYGPMCVEAIRF